MIRLFGITLKQKWEIRKKQGNRCIICTEKFKSKRDCHLDHNHKTGRMRELLCNKCNAGIGLLGEDVEILQRAIDYLNKHNSREVKNA